jgi:hypothetical protein
MLLFIQRQLHSSIFRILQRVDKPEFSQSDYLETLSFLPDKSLTLTTQSNNLISGLNLETTGTQITWIRADRLICTKTSVLNDPISQVETPEISHQAANKGYVDSRFIAYTPTIRMNLQFEALYARKSDLQTTNLRVITLLRKISPSANTRPLCISRLQRDFPT